MILTGKICVTFDVEVLRNCFLCTTYHTETNEINTFELSERKNDLQKLIEFFTTNDFYFVGYNCIHYDTPILNYIITKFKDNQYSTMVMCNSIYNLSQIIISNEDTERWKPFKYANIYSHIDLMTMMYSKALRVSLKALQVTMNYKNVQEMDIDWSKNIDITNIDALIGYNINDVLSTAELLNRCEKDLHLRLDIEKEYKIKCLSKDGVGIGVKLLAKRYLQATKQKWEDIENLRSPMDYIPLKDVILPQIQYDTPILQDILNELKASVVSPGRKGLNKQFILNGRKISIGVGGIHSINKPEIIIPKDDELLLDTDAASLYPTLLIEYGFYPQHLGKEFVEIYSQIRTERLEAKHSGKKNKDTTLKLLLNSVTGNLQNKYSWLYSPFAVMQIRMNGQLLLLKLAEMLIAIDCKIIQYNTDGLFLICKKNRKEEYDQVIKEFEQLSRLTMETEHFKAMYQYAINDYFAVCDNGKIKEKGMFLTNVALGKGLTPKIIPKAIQKYFLEKIPIRETIKNCTEIKDFLMSEKTGKQWEVSHNQETQQRVNRFYASTNGRRLIKRKQNTDGTFQENDMLSTSVVTILNTFDNKPIKERNINYNYYIGECEKIIFELEPRQLTLF